MESDRESLRYPLLTNSPVIVQLGTMATWMIAGSVLVEVGLVGYAVWVVITEKCEEGVFFWCWLLCFSVLIACSVLDKGSQLAKRQAKPNSWANCAVILCIIVGLVSVFAVPESGGAIEQAVKVILIVVLTNIVASCCILAWVAMKVLQISEAAAEESPKQGLPDEQ